MAAPRQVLVPHTLSTVPKDGRNTIVKGELYRGRQERRGDPDTPGPDFRKGGTKGQNIGFTRTFLQRSNAKQDFPLECTVREVKVGSEKVGWYPRQTVDLRRNEELASCWSCRRAVPWGHRTEFMAYLRQVLQSTELFAVLLNIDHVNEAEKIQVTYEQAILCCESTPIRGDKLRLTQVWVFIAAGVSCDVPALNASALQHPYISLAPSVVFPLALYPMIDPIDSTADIAIWALALIAMHNFRLTARPNLASVVWAGVQYYVHFATSRIQRNISLRKRSSSGGGGVIDEDVKMDENKEDHSIPFRTIDL
ncbi:hypothetical protein K474DRAFT_1675013 [Panus rudis PR-1116 ss-1]|nr:hypothetical protein K474DRAFT_1675013 [Panus rudis PR-1116 ss-1]